MATPDTETVFPVPTFLLSKVALVFEIVTASRFTSCDELATTVAVLLPS